MRAEWREALDASQVATARLPLAGTAWFSATAGALLAGTCVPDVSAVVNAVRAVMKAPLPLRPSGPHGVAVFFASQGLTQVNQLDAATELIARAEATLAESVNSADDACSMWLHNARATLQLRQGELGGALANLHSASVLSDRIGAVLARATTAMLSVAVLCQTGHVDRVVAAAHQARSLAESSGQRVLSDWVALFLSCMNVDASGQALGPDKLRASLQQLLERKDYRLAAAVRTSLAFELLKAGDVKAAEHEATRAVDGAVFPSDRSAALAIRALIEVDLGRPQDALKSAERALELTGSSLHGWNGSQLGLARARALHALGRIDEARNVIRDARERLWRVAATLPDTELRDAYFAFGPHRHTLQLAREWLTEELA
jgi:tetratricopeptide (TPR) repeat protein